GYQTDFAERCFQQIEGFADYGFPESHAASFALLVYVSAWLKCHYPAAFACALLNSQPMGFYAPAQIIGDARRHGVEVRPVDVNGSQWDCTLESIAGTVLRLGFRQVKGLSPRDAEALVAARGDGFRSITDLWRRSGLAPAVLTTLARADGFGSLGLDRRRALWAVRGLDQAPIDLFDAADAAQSREPAVHLPAAGLGEQVAEDYRALRLSLKAHPLALLRAELRTKGHLASDQLGRCRHGGRIKIAGLVVTRQRPGTASGVIFVTLEDEFGHANLIIWPKVFERFRKEVLGATLMAVAGPVQREGDVVHILAEHIWDHTPILRKSLSDPDPAQSDTSAKFEAYSRDFH
ncbi:MAG: error-prone DNA polymerase, partial [Rhodospirillales bacterium]|nr:error-prone DNA polymerase [Rhodospirillales bacterium]